MQLGSRPSIPSQREGRLKDEKNLIKTIDIGDFLCIMLRYVVAESRSQHLRRRGGAGFCAGRARGRCRETHGKSRTYPPPPEFVLSSRDAADILVGRASGDLDFRQWLAARQLRVYEHAEDAFAGALSQRAMQLPFVKRARVDLQTSLGGRKGAGGVDVAGAFAEDDSGILGWQLRAYAAEHGAKGLNTGMFYRRVVGGALAGVNVFADYEDGEDGDFWRWSVGGDVKNRLGELSANHYFAITDAQVVGGKTTYTREGYDVDIAARIPRLEWAKARIGYYNFKGEFGDEDENGFRAGLDLSPGAGLVLGVEYDDDDGKFGGNISYTHHFGETSRGAQRAGDFNPRAHFYDSVRREYSQRISRASGGGGLVIVGTGVNVEVKNAAMTVTVTANTVAVNVSFPLVNSITVTNIAGNNGAVTMRGGAWHLTLSGANAALAFLNGTVINIVRGMGSFNSGGGNISEVVMDGERITLLGTRFDFNVVPGGDALITLHEGGLGIPARGVRVEAADMATVRIGNDTVGCGEGEIAMTTGAAAKCEVDNAVTVVDMTLVTEDTSQNVLAGSISLAGSNAGISAHVDNAAFTVTDNGNAGFNVHLIAASVVADRNVKVARVTVRGGALRTAKEFVFMVRVNPHPITLMFVNNANSAPVTTGGDITIGVLEVTNGFNAQNINIVGARGDFRLDNVDGFANRRLLILGGNNNNERAATVVLRGDDSENSTDAASLTVVVSVMERVALLGGGRYTVFAIDPDSATVVTFRPAGGTPHAVNGYGNQRPVNIGTYTGLAWLNSAGKTSYIVRNGTDDTPGNSYTFISEVSDTRDTVQATATVTVIASLNAAIDFAGGALTAGMAATVATISAAGGIGDYAYSANNNAVSFVDGTIAVANFNNAGTISVNLIANDNAAITEPFTIVITLTALNTAMAAPDNATFREFQTGASVTLANLTYSGATGGGNVTATVITVQNGAGEVGGRELLVSSDMRGTSEVQVAVYDSANAAAPQSTLTLSLEFVAPLTAAFSGNPNFAPLTNNAANIVIATVTISGGDGEYGNPHLQVNMQDFAFTDNTILILNNTESRNESGRTVTALIVADDNSNISEQASLSVSVVVADMVMINGGGRFTVFTEADENEVVAAFQPAGGVKPYGNLVKLSPATFPDGFQASPAAASITITRTNTDAAADSEHIFAYEVTDATDGGGVVATATATVTVIASLSAGIEFAGGALDTGADMTVATLSASGGAGGYAFSANNDGIRFVDGTIAVANFADIATVSVDLIADDDNAPITEPVTFGITVTVLAPLIIEPIVVTLTTGTTPGGAGQATPFQITASGGQAPLAVGLERRAGSPLFWSSGVGIVWAGLAAQSQTGTVSTDQMSVRDSSNPVRRKFTPVTIIYVAPPSDG